LSDSEQILHFNKGSIFLAVFVKLLLAGRFPSFLLGLAGPALDTPLLVRPSIYTRFKIKHPQIGAIMHSDGGRFNDADLNCVLLAQTISSRSCKLTGFFARSSSCDGTSGHLPDSWPERAQPDPTNDAPALLPNHWTELIQPSPTDDSRPHLPSSWSEHIYPNTRDCAPACPPASSSECIYSASTRTRTRTSGTKHVVYIRQHER